MRHMCFLAFSHQYLHNFLSKATHYFSHMLQQRWEGKIRRKESSSQPCLELTTTKSWVRNAHHWATRVGLAKMSSYQWIRIRCYNNIFRSSLYDILHESAANSFLDHFRLSSLIHVWKVVSSFGKKCFVSIWVKSWEKHRFVTDRHDMTSCYNGVDKNKTNKEDNYQMHFVEQFRKQKC